MSENSAFEFVRQLGRDLQAGEFELPPFPDTAAKVQKCTQDADSDIQDLTSIIAQEPALAARLMRMANSPLMRRSSIEVIDIPTAILRVGHDMVLNAAVSFAARQAFRCPPDSPVAGELNQLRVHSTYVASISFVLAKNTPRINNPDEAMLAGLLHAVGKFYIYMKAADHPSLFTDNDVMQELIVRWHTSVARAIVESWSFSSVVAQGIDEQELRERDRLSPPDLSDILFLANIVSRAGFKAAHQLGDLDALARLRMDAGQLAVLLESNEEEIQFMAQAMGG